MRVLLLLIPFLAAGAGCTSIAPIGPLTGAWGGMHVGLQLSSEGGELEYDCAAGRISHPVIPGADGRFAATGTHTPGTGGPERVGEVRPSWPAHYSGSVRGDEMTLRVDVPGRAIVIGPHRLRRGARPILLRCL